MDHQHHLLLDSNGTLTPATTFIRLLGRIKGLHTTAAELPGVTLTPAIEYRGIQIQGFWPAVNYLLDIRPYPELLPDTPDKRGIARSLTEMILTETACLGQLAALYQTQPPHALGHMSLVDLAVAVYSDTLFSARYPWIDTVAENLEQFIASEEFAS